MPRLPVLAPVASLTPAPTIAPNTAAGEARTVAHQAFAQFPPQRFYEMSEQAGTVLMAPPGELPPQTIWGFNGRTPGPLIVERYGNLGNPGAGSVLLRLRNNLAGKQWRLWASLSYKPLAQRPHTARERWISVFLHGTRTVLRSSLSKRVCRHQFNTSRHRRYQGSDAHALVSRPSHRSHGGKYLQRSRRRIHSFQ